MYPEFIATAVSSPLPILQAFPSSERIGRRRPIRQTSRPLTPLGVRSRPERRRLRDAELPPSAAVKPAHRSPAPTARSQHPASWRNAGKERGIAH